MNETQKQAVRTSIDGMAENAQEDARHNPADHGVSHGEDFTWAMAVAEACDTVCMVVREEGVQAAIDQGYMDDAAAGADPAEVVAFVQSVKG